MPRPPSEAYHKKTQDTSTMEYLKTCLVVKLALAMVLVSASLAPPTAGAVEFLVENALAGTALGKSFDDEVGESYARQILAKASRFAWMTLGQDDDPGDRKPFHTVTLRVEGTVGHHASLTRGSVIHLGGGRAMDILTGHETFDKEQVTGVIYHEATNLWQYDGQGAANRGLLAGIADVVQMRAGHAPAEWAKAGEGQSWDERKPGVTAQFLEYCERQKPGFLAQLGAMMKMRYTERFFSDITGKSVGRLWKEYKSMYA